ncbi:MAG: carboxypeptidase regulatory-like domain-containing protein [Candidatus Riflebacteria bacterium]|nr:carboxypeptidase regulatory-like domain-containing protein [Candidatus Riflebacteria bacterium]
MGTRIFGLVAVSVLLLVVAGSVLAQDAASFWGPYPSPVDDSNPWAGRLVDARQRLEASIRSYWRVYEANPWDYYALWGAYYEYVYAYRWYRWTLSEYLKANRARRAFTGRVMRRGPEIDLPPYERPVEGSTITLSTHVPPGQGRPVQLIGRRTTGADGRFACEGLAPDTYDYAVTWEGFAPINARISLAEPQPERTIYLEKMRVLEGVVKVPQMFGILPIDYTPDRYAPRPVANAKVTIGPSAVIAIYPPPQVWTKTVHTGPDGRFRFEAVPLTEVQLTVELPGYRQYAQIVRLERSVTVKDVVLTYDGPPIPIARPDGTAAPEVRPSAGLDDPFR